MSNEYCFNLTLKESDLKSFIINCFKSNFICLNSITRETLSIDEAYKYLLRENDNLDSFLFLKMKDTYSIVFSSINPNNSIIIHFFIPFEKWLKQRIASKENVDFDYARYLYSILDLCLGLKILSIEAHSSDFEVNEYKEIAKPFLLVNPILNLGIASKETYTKNLLLAAKIILNSGHLNGLTYKKNINESLLTEDEASEYFENQIIEKLEAEIYALKKALILKLNLKYPMSLDMKYSYFRFYEFWMIMLY